MTSGLKSRARLEGLDDYVSGHMPDAEAERFEEALFAEAARSSERDADVAVIDRIVRFGGYLDSHHTFHPGATRADIDAMLASSRRIAYVDLGRGQGSAIRYSRSADQLVMRLEVDLEGIEKVDVEILMPSRGLSKTMRDIRFDPNDGELFACCEMPLAVLSAETEATWRIVGTGGGRRRTLAEITLPTELTD